MHYSLHFQLGNCFDSPQPTRSRFWNRQAHAI